MDGFSYTNIFDTKGIEYIIIIGFLILIIPFWIILNRPLNLKTLVKEVVGVLSEGVLRIPEGLFFSKHHTWAFLEKSGMARMGADDLLLHITGDVKFEPLRTPGDRISKGESFARLLKDGKLLELTSPLSGEVMAVNRTILEDQDVIRKDPYEKGWICMIKPEKWQEETGSCYLADNAREWLKNELKRFKEFIVESVNKQSPLFATAILQEGGELRDHPLSEMPGEIWHDFQESFLD